MTNPRKVGGGWEWLERWGVRGFVTYAAIRAAGWSTGWLEAETSALKWLHTIDLLMLMIPAALLLTNLAGWRRDRIGKLVYLGSVCLLYTGVLLSLWIGWARGIVTFAAAGSMFHAVEYLAVVTHYAHRREKVGSAGIFQSLARHWLQFLALYVLALGAAGAWMSHPDNGILVLWQGMNL